MVTSVLLICLADHGNNSITWSNVTVLVGLFFFCLFAHLLVSRNDCRIVR